MEEQSRQFVTKSDIEDMKKDITLMHGVLFGDNGDLKHSIVYILERICENFDNHMKFHEKQDNRTWDIIKVLIGYLLTTGLGAGIMYIFTK
jgi:hypothetical protein